MQEHLQQVICELTSFWSLEILTKTKEKVWGWIIEHLKAKVEILLNVQIYEFSAGGKLVEPSFKVRLVYECIWLLPLDSSYKNSKQAEQMHDWHIDFAEFNEESKICDSFSEADISQEFPESNPRT